MARVRVNITVPAELLRRARVAGLNVSAVAAAALTDKLDSRAKIAALDTYLAEFDAELGPISEPERTEARADQLTPVAQGSRSA
ncbi:MAG: type II toxin-antitoxin system CcdA family antitoxin [Pseudonocardia sp.]